ncbi:MAG: cytochrome c [Sphingomicrobium sp.]
MKRVDRATESNTMAQGKFLDLHRHLPSAAFVAVLALVVAGFAGAFIYAGVYNIGADAPHSRIVYMALDRMRERAIAHHARDIAVPRDLNDAKRIAAGAGLYTEMCTGCHLGPGVEKSEMSQGLYPPAPELARTTDRSAQQQFWIIKHGVKLSAMPAWGKTHGDQLIWDMVAFIRQLPKMTPQQYRAIVASAPADHDEMMKDMPGMSGMTAAPAKQDESKPHSHAPGHTHN